MCVPKHAPQTPCVTPHDKRHLRQQLQQHHCSPSASKTASYSTAGTYIMVSILQPCALQLLPSCSHYSKGAPSRKPAAATCLLLAAGWQCCKLPSGAQHHQLTPGMVSGLQLLAPTSCQPCRTTHQLLLLLHALLWRLPARKPAAHLHTVAAAAAAGDDHTNEVTDKMSLPGLPMATSAPKTVSAVAPLWHRGSGGRR